VTGEDVAQIAAQSAAMRQRVGEMFDERASRYIKITRPVLDGMLDTIDDLLDEIRLLRGDTP
jgi:hypothetical protein